MKSKKFLTAMTGIIMGGTIMFGGALSLAACGDPEGTPPPVDPPPPAVTELKVTKSGGYEEGAYVEFSVPASTTSVKVSYKLSGGSAYTEIDGELVRKTASGYRADVVGIKKGTYTLKVEDKTANKTVEVADVAVDEYDRSGYADYGVRKLAAQEEAESVAYEDSKLKGDYLGAYNKDGTLKANAEVVYVTEETKNTVSVEWDKTYTGIANILNNLKNANHPVAIRVIGKISAATWQPFSYENVLEEDGSLAIGNVKGRNGNSMQEYAESLIAAQPFTESKELSLTAAQAKILTEKGIKLYTKADKDAKKTDTPLTEFADTGTAKTKYYTNWELTGKGVDIHQADIIAQGWNTLDTSVYSALKGASNDAMQNKVKYTVTNNLKWYDEQGNEASTGTVPKWSEPKFDSSFNQCWIMGTKDQNDYINATFEGIGTDAELFQWGVSWKRVSSVEVRNLTFDDYTEDACAFEGVSADWADPDKDAQTIIKDNKEKSVLGPTRYLWAHNNTFNEGKNYWDVTDEQDKGEGDGATDLKGNAYVTFSYNHYVKNHKTGLVGSGDSSADAHITFHHNFYDECASRLPLARMANMHMYNNYYYKSTSYSISLRSTAYAFVENCYFEDNTKVFDYSGTDFAAKVLGCEFVKSPYTESGELPANIVIATTRDKEVTNKNTYVKGYFDIDKDNFYYDDVAKVTKVTRLTSAEQAKQDCIKLAGVHK